MVVAATGSAVVPSGAVVGTVVSTQAALNTAIANSAAGDVIRVAPGVYSEVALGNRVNAGSQVTIIAAEPGNPPRFTNGVTGNGCAGWRIDNLILGPAADPTAGNRVGASCNLTRPVRITVRNCLLENCEHGFAWTEGSTDCIIEANEVRKAQNDCIRLYNRHRNLIVRNNYTHGKVPHPTRADHRDSLQIATLDANSQCSDITIERNHFVGLNNSMHQGILIRNAWILGTGPNPPAGEPPQGGSWPADGHDNIVIRGNYVQVRHVHGITVSCTRNALYENNLIRRLGPDVGFRPDSDNSSRPGISIFGPSTGIIRNNIVSRSGPMIQTETSTGIDMTGSTSMFTTWNVTASDTAVPSGWVQPTAGRYALD